MIEITPNEEFINKNYEKTINFIRQVYKLEEEKVFIPPLLRMIEDFGVRYALCPASSSQNYYSSFPGGLCYHNLHVLQWLTKFANLLSPKEFSHETLLKISILHEIGKVGTKEVDLYIPVTEDWKKKSGNNYKINDDISYMKTNQRSLHLAMQYGIFLTEDEYLAILLADPNDDANKSYKYKEPKLALILQFAKQWAQKVEKTFTINWS